MVIPVDLLNNNWSDMYDVELMHMCMWEYMYMLLVHAYKSKTTYLNNIIDGTLFRLMVHCLIIIVLSYNLHLLVEMSYLGLSRMECHLSAVKI